jgi:hypothetical protein
MVRECVALSVAALVPGCSLILNFDESAPIDASIDAPYTQAECDYKEPNNSLADAVMIDPATDTGPAAICKPMSGNPEDEDYYKFTVVNASVTVRIAFMNRPGGDLDIKLWDAANMTNPVAQSRGFGDGEMITCPGASPSCPTLVPGDYILQVFPAVPGSVNSYTFMITP